MKNTFEVNQIGIIKRTGKTPKIILDERYKPALLEVDNFSHVMVVWWGHKYEKYRDSIDMQMLPPYAPEVLTGLFALPEIKE